MEKDEVTEMDMSAAIGKVLDDSDIPDENLTNDPDSDAPAKKHRKKKQLDDQVVQNRRAVWINHSRITAERAVHRARKLHNAVKKAAAASTKASKAASSPSTAATMAATKKRGRNDGGVAAKARKAART